MDALVWDATTFSKDRERLLAVVVAQPRVAALMSDKHFSLNGTLIQAWASHKIVSTQVWRRRWRLTAAWPGCSWTGPQRRAELAFGRGPLDEASPGYAVIQRVRKRIEEVFGWIKPSAGLRQTKHRGRGRVGGSFDLAATAYNLVRLPKLLEANR